MSNLKLLVAMGLVCCTAAAIAKQENPDLDSEWSDWKTTFSKTYADTAEEKERRFVWEENLKLINLHNIDIKKKGYTLRMNGFGDKRLHEFRNTVIGYRTSNYTMQQGNTFLNPSNVNVPDTVDWRTEGYVTPVKNQGLCHSDWAFSTTGSLEGQMFRKTSKLTSLSEQNLIDCSSSYGNEGCQGGLVDNGFRYIQGNGGIDSGDCYPYHAESQICQYNPSCDSAEVTGYVDIKRQDEDALKSAVALVGPISVAIDASHYSFQFYHSGVYDEPQCSNIFLTQCVLVVGYGNYGGKDFWLVKNSWGTSWGSDGYIMMSRNKNNQCGIATMASYPLV
ncbi:procathepsin L-like [Lytechinus pictus]|uniref:procathepsin L-like n=1 Tax=Lytechinus pictus TaxID=7653 RepID=UPI0030B9D09D